MSPERRPEAARPRSVEDDLTERIVDRVPIDWPSEADAEQTQGAPFEGLRVIDAVSRAFRAVQQRDGPVGPASDRETEGAPDGQRRTWGPFSIRRQLGAGGFARVYEAFDEDLDRVVALKLLKEGTSADARERFLREARRLARVRHPNVLSVHGAAVHGGEAGLWAERIEGRTLVEWCEQNGPLGPGEAVSVGRDLAGALAAIHRAGLVHGDVKPSNVMREIGGRIVLMDFGAARERHGSWGSEPVEGTPATVAPEVLDGREASPASDVYSLGVLLHFLLTGHYPHEESSPPDPRRALESGERPPLADLRPDLPPGLIGVVERALERDPGARLSSAGELERALRDLAGAGSVTAGVAGRPGRSGRRAVWGWLAAGLALLATGPVLWGGLPRWMRSGPRGGPVRASIPLPPDAPLLVKPIPGVVSPSIALSRDGRRLAYVTRSGETSEIRVRDLAAHEVTGLRGTDGAHQLFFSPDGSWVGFAADAKLKKVPAKGGLAVELADAELLLGAHWSPDGRIFFAPRPGRGIHVVSENGGTAQPVTALDLARGETTHCHPFLLADGRTLLFASQASGDAATGVRIEAERLDTGERRAVVDGAWSRVLPTGHLLWSRGNSVYAAVFDEAALTIRGAEREVFEGLLMSTVLGVSPPLDVSDTGTAAWVAGDAGPSGSGIARVDRTGRASPIELPRGVFLHPRLSPDGRRLLLTSRTSSDDVWLLDLNGGPFERLTFEGENLAPIWEADGRGATVSHHGVGPVRLHRLATDGKGLTRRWTSGDTMDVAGSWSPAGDKLAFTRLDSVTGKDIWLLRLDGEVAEERFLATRFDESQPAFSPDGRWLAYVSDATGRPEVHVRSSEGGAFLRQVSVGGGVEPRWSPGGDSLYFWYGRRFFEARLSETAGELRVESAEPLFDMTRERNEFGPSYDVAPDGTFVITRPGGSAAAPAAIELTLDWFAVLEDHMRSRAP